MTTLTLIDKAFFLRRTPLFATLELDLLLTIADKLTTLNYREEDQIFVVDEEANRMYFIVSGKVEIRSRTGKKITILGKEEFFGEESLFSNKMRGYSAHCTTETVLLSLLRSTLYMIISECPSVGLGFLQVYSSAVDFRPINFQDKAEQ